MLDVLMEYRRDWATQCVYCGRDVVNPRLIPKQYNPQHVGGDHDKIRFTINGRSHLALQATADHYFDKCYGGHSTLNNILPACRPCNNARSFGRQWPMCIDCGIYRRTHGKRCQSCRRAMDVKHEEHCARERAIGALYHAMRLTFLQQAIVTATQF